MARPRKDQQLGIRTRAIQETMTLLNDRDAAALKLTEVALAVGCKAPALYSHFANKDALLLAVHDAGFDQMMGEKLALAVVHAKDAMGRLDAGGRAYVGFALDHPGLYQLMFAPPRHILPAEDRLFDRDPAKACLDLLTTAVKACQAEGYLPGHEAPAVAYTLWSSVHGAAALALQNRALAPGSAEGLRAAALGVVETQMAFIRASKNPG